MDIYVNVLADKQILNSTTVYSHKMQPKDFPGAEVSGISVQSALHEYIYIYINIYTSQ